MIENYYFGSITINGKNYNYDVEVRWSPKEKALGGPTGQVGEVLKWWRKESHIIDVEDIKRAMDQNPEIIIIGTGESGLAEVTQRVQNFIREKGIELIIERTGEAVKTFNIIKEKSEQEGGYPREIIGLFHLTC